VFVLRVATARSPVRSTISLCSFCVFLIRLLFKVEYKEERGSEPRRREGRSAAGSDSDPIQSTASSSLRLLSPVKSSEYSYTCPPHSSQSKSRPNPVGAWVGVISLVIPGTVAIVVVYDYILYYRGVSALYLGTNPAPTSRMEARVCLHTASSGSSTCIQGVSMRLGPCRPRGKVPTAYCLCSPNVPTNPQPHAHSTNYYNQNYHHELYLRPQSYASRAGSLHSSGSRLPRACHSAAAGSRACRSHTQVGTPVMALCDRGWSCRARRSSRSRAAVAVGSPVARLSGTQRRRLRPVLPSI